MAILRKVKKNDFTVIDNNIFKNKDLSYKAKGLLCTMLSLPDDWAFNEEGLSSLSSDGISSVRTTLKELMTFGYLERTRARDNKGILRDTVYTIYEEPTLENPRLDKPTLENLKTYKILNNKELNNKENTNINISTKEKNKKPTLEEVEEYCKERNSPVNPKAFYDYFEVGGWVDSKGNKVKNWKQKLLTWEKFIDNSRTKMEPVWFEEVHDINKASEKEQKEMEEILNGFNNIT